MSDNPFKRVIDEHNRLIEADPVLKARLIAQGVIHPNHPATTWADEPCAAPGEREGRGG